MYDVVWTLSAIAHLADIWVASRIRSQVREAADRIDQLLQADPLHVGESSEGIGRIAFQAPLAFSLAVLPRERRVIVAEVWVY